jgi:hypothetical protein
MLGARSLVNMENAPHVLGIVQTGIAYTRPSTSIGTIVNGRLLIFDVITLAGMVQLGRISVAQRFVCGPIALV